MDLRLCSFWVAPATFPEGTTVALTRRRYRGRLPPKLTRTHCSVTFSRHRAMQSLIAIITSPDPRMRNQSLDAHCSKASGAELLSACAELDSFRRGSDNLYERVRALFFLYAIHRFHLPLRFDPIGARHG